MAANASVITASTSVATTTTTAAAMAPAATTAAIATQTVVASIDIVRVTIVLTLPLQGFQYIGTLTAYISCKSSPYYTHGLCHIYFHAPRTITGAEVRHLPEDE